MPNPFDNLPPTSPNNSSAPPSDQNFRPNPATTHPSSSNPTPPPTSNKFAEIEKLQQSITSGQQLSNNDDHPNNPDTTVPATPFYLSIINFLGQSKKIIFIILAILLVAGIGGGVYYYLNQHQATIKLTLTDQPDHLTINNIDYPTDQSNQEITVKPGTYIINATKDLYYPYNNTFELTSQQTKEINISLQSYPSSNKIIEYTTSFPHLDPTETELSYLSNFGTTFYLVRLDNPQKGTGSPNTFNHIINAVWAPSSRKAVLITSLNDPTLHQYQTSNQLYQTSRPLNSVVYSLFDFSKYDLVNQNLLVYPTTVKNPSWHPTKEEIIYHYVDPTTGENTLSKSKPNLDNREPLVELAGFSNVLSKYSPDEEMIAIVDQDQSTSAEPNPVYLFYTVPRNFEKIPTKDNYIDFIWSPDSTKLIAFKNNNQPTIFDIKTYQATDLDFKATANRVAWFSSSDKLIIFPLDSSSTDQMLVYDIATSQTEPIKTKDANNFQTVTDPILNRANNIMYYIGDNYLYSLAIK